MSPERALFALWLAWFVSWHVAMLWTSRIVRRDDRAGRPVMLGLVALGFAAMFGFRPGRNAGSLELWTAGPVLAWVAVAGLALSFAFMWWARLHLGRLWSGGIVLREGHRIVDTGPYGLVRHPIYTGLIAAALCTLVLFGTWPALAGFALLAAGFGFKARAEESFLRREFGGAYDAYRRRVPMLVPFGPKSA